MTVYGKLLSGVFRQLDGGAINFLDAVLQIELAKDEAGCSERVGLKHVATGSEKIRMNVANDVRTAESENLAAVFLAPVVIQRGIALLDIGAHGAVIDDDTLADEWQKISHVFQQSVLESAIVNVVLSFMHKRRCANGEPA